jgi:hypothetical protein
LIGTDQILISATNEINFNAVIRLKVLSDNLPFASLPFSFYFLITLFLPYFQTFSLKNYLLDSL